MECRTDTLVGGTGEIFDHPLEPRVSAYGQGDEPLAELTVPIRQSTVQSQSVNRLLMYSGEESLYRIPVEADDRTVGENDYSALLNPMTAWRSRYLKERLYCCSPWLCRVDLSKGTTFLPLYRDCLWDFYR